MDMRYQLCFYFSKKSSFLGLDSISLKTFTPTFSITGRNSFYHRIPHTTTIGDSTLEVSVLLLTNPLLVGKFGGKTLPRSCVFPELLQTIDEIKYTCLASRMTSLDGVNADKVLNTYGIVQDEKRRRVMVRCDFVSFVFLLLFYDWYYLANYFLESTRTIFFPNLCSSVCYSYIWITLTLENKKSLIT